MKVLVADPISPKGVELLKQQGFDTVEAYGSSPEEVKKLIADADAVIVRSETKITADVLDCAKRLKAVGRAGVGVDNIDVPAASERGVVVMNTPTGNTVATAELTFTHMLCGARPIAQANASIHGGVWDRKSFKGTELKNKTLAILGMGRIGTEVAKRAMAFGMKVIAYDPFLTEARAKTLGVDIVELDFAFKNADYITVHMPLTDATRHMVDERAFEMMKSGVRIFNCARGGIVKESALVEALKSGKVAAAGLDVYESEPLAADSPLRAFPNLVLTPHLGASTKEAQESCGIEVAEVIADALNGGAIRNSINKPSVDAESMKQISPYVRLCEKLGTFIQQLCKNRVEKLSVKYFGKLGNIDNKLLTLAVEKGYLSKISENANDVNAPAKIKHLGIEVESVNSTADEDYSELIEVCVRCENGESHSVAGTLMGAKGRPRIVRVGANEVEVSANNRAVMLLRNRDVPGMLGKIATIIGKHGCNIANMTLSRAEGESTALSVFELDAILSPEALAEVGSVDMVERVCIVDFQQ
ncbi:MAG: phosphoglycerate dehydrogenase [Verrucomicrobia bacterium]|nr:MAG: phosphoglycerate dehydrogenase [Verrucomicrobiota bacterium]